MIVENYKVYLDDCLDFMEFMPDDAVDSIVTDPPYGLGFMGNDWDHAVPGVEFWTEALRVAKPGAHLLAFGGARTSHRLSCAIEDAGWELRDTLMWVYGSGFPKSKNLDGDWEGWGTALKPAWEPIILARKPLCGTVAQNVQQHGTGALNIDGCRIDAEPRRIENYASEGGQGCMSHGHGGGPGHAGKPRDARIETAGRWPANVIHDGSGEVVGLFPDSNGSGRARTLKRGERDDGWGMSDEPGELRDAGTGSAARFFYCAKASKKDREDGNTHPTVKPTDLMRWLCRLVTPPDGLVFDLFTGSGSTGKAAALEGFRFIGVEKDAEHFNTARRRVGRAYSATRTSESEKC